MIPAQNTRRPRFVTIEEAGEICWSCNIDGCVFHAVAITHFCNDSISTRVGAYAMAGAHLWREHLIRIAPIEECFRG